MRSFRVLEPVGPSTSSLQVATLSSVDISSLSLRDAALLAVNSAEEVLLEHGNETLGVDPVRVARSLRLSVFQSDTVGDVVGVFRPSQHGGEIFLERDLPAVRASVLCAHLVGHYLHEVPRGLKDGVVDRLSDLLDVLEHAAQVFAQHLLVPSRAPRVVREARLSPVASAAYLKVDLAIFQARARPDLLPLSPGTTDDDGGY